MLATFATAWFLLRYTRFGTHVMAIGGDEHAARLGGVRVVKVKILLYTISALAAGRRRRRLGVGCRFGRRLRRVRLERPAGDHRRRDHRRHGA